MRSVEAAVGGDGGVIGLSGSLTPASMARVFDAMGLTSDSVLLDAGAGIGRPLVQAAATYRLPVALGYEFDPIKVQKSAPFIERCLRALIPDTLTARPGTDASSHVIVFDKDLASIRSNTRNHTRTITHVFSFWEGIAPDARKGVASICCDLPALERVAVVQRGMRLADPVESMRGYGFPRLRLVNEFSVTSVGSGRQYVAYVFLSVSN